jgi:hypothetical protein
MRETNIKHEEKLHFTFSDLNRDMSSILWDMTPCSSIALLAVCFLSVSCLA